MTQELLNPKEITEVFRRLNKKYPNPKAPLRHGNAYQLLVAVILSAQCTDERVNKVTPVLFKKAKSPNEMIRLGMSKLKNIIHSCGFYNAKSKNIMGMSGMLQKEFKGRVPNKLDKLVKLPGVATKTASVVLSQWFKKPAFPVDTHVFRLSNRIGLVKEKTPDKTYQALIKRVPERYWRDGSLQLVFHGRETCTARKPKCKTCVLKTICRYNKGGLVI